MRQSNPKIIIATTTLAQGVNLGVSSVIIADIWLGKPGNSKKLPLGKFWNIVGRAGRAFVDSEGKVLFAIDQNGGDWKNKEEKNTANEYLLSKKNDDAFSGIISMIIELEKIASKYKVDFELLLELISENYEEAETTISEADFIILQNKLDLLDDTLLALNEKKMSWNDEDSSGWIDSFFRKSLAYIQAKNNADYNEGELIRYFKNEIKLSLIKRGSILLGKNILILEYH
jgi:superfamily II RNA helicase